MENAKKNNYFKYLNITAAEEKWGLYVTTVGYSRVEPDEEYPTQQHPQSHELTWNRGRILSDYYLVFISKGKGAFCSSLTEPSELEEGTCFFLFPGVWHRYKPNLRSGWEEYWIGFHGSYADQLMEQKFFSPRRPCIHTGLDKDLLMLFNRIIDLVKSSLVGYPQQIAGMMLQVLGMVNAISVSKQLDHSPVEKLISKARFLLHESFERPVNMHQLAIQLPMGYASFRKNFKLVTGHAPHQYHLNLRIERAKELLLSTTLSIDEIAEQIGFDSIFYFSKIFKRKMGISPNSYRKQACQLSREESGLISA